MEPLHPYRRWFGLRDGAALKDPVFHAAIEASGGRSIIPSKKLENLFLIVRDEIASLPHRDVVEFGAYRGGSALFLAYLLREFCDGAQVFALDTFHGMPADASRPVDRHN